MEEIFMTPCNLQPHFVRLAEAYKRLKGSLNMMIRGSLP